jgi:hypothetical protein
MEGLEKVPVLVDKLDDMFLAYGNTVHSDSFTEVYQMRGSVETYLITG